MADGSQKPTFKDYGIPLPAHCEGCGRKLVAAHEPAMWFTGYPKRAVYGSCCLGKAEAA